MKIKIKIERTHSEELIYHDVISYKCPLNKKYCRKDHICCNHFLGCHSIEYAECSPPNSVQFLTQK